jgi:hypothetical protein
MPNLTPAYYTHDASTGYYPFPITAPSGVVNPIETATGWSAWVADGYALNQPNMVTISAVRQSVQQFNLVVGNNALAHGLTDPLTGGPPSEILVIPVATPSGIVFPTAAANATDIFVNSAAAQTVTLALLY